MSPPTERPSSIRPDPGAVLPRAVTPWMVTVLAVATLGLGLTPEPAAPQPLAEDPTYRIGPRDVVEFEVYELPELNVQRRVSEVGTVSLPVLGELAVQGETVSSLAAKLDRILEDRFVTEATVSVQVVEHRFRSFSVLGAVKQPGQYGLPGERTLLEALTAAGGLAGNHGPRIHILRRAPNGLSDQLTVPVEKLLREADRKYNVPILPDDIINVEAQEQVRVYLLGEVSSPGVQTFQSTERATLIYAIARAGGLTDRASTKIVLQRRGEGKEAEQITVHYKRILSGKEPDVELQDGDVLVVKESFF